MRSVEAGLLRSGKLREFCARVPVLASRAGTPLNAALMAQFDVIDAGVHVVVLDAGGGTLDQFWFDTLWSCTDADSLERYPELLVEKLEASLRLSTAVEALEEAWRARPGDTAAFSAWIDRLEELKRFRQVERVCRGADGPLARIRGYAVRARCQRPFAAGERDALVRGGEDLLVEFADHPESWRARVTLATAGYLAGFDVAARCEAGCARLLARSPTAAMRAHVAEIEKARDVTIGNARRAAVSVQGDAASYYAVTLGVAEPVVATFANDGRPDAREWVRDARRKLEAR